jgi:LmbE family N-acetylglucosaminyl deacetylase
VPDGEVTNDLDLRGRLVELIRRHRPDGVVAPDPTAVFFGDS